MAVSYTLVLSFFYLASGVFIFLLGLTILRTGSGSAPTRATALMLFFAGVGPILTASSIILQTTIDPGVALDRSAFDSFEYLWEFFFPSLLLFALTYPRESRGAPAFSVLALVLFAPYIFHLVTIMSGGGIFSTASALVSKLPIDREITVAGRVISFARIADVLSAIFGSLVKLHRHLFSVVNVLYAFGALYVIFRRMRLQMNPRIAGQLRTVVVGLVVGINAYLLAKILSFFPGEREGVTLALVNLGLIAGGGSVAYAVIRQQFLGIRYVARKSVLYGAAALLFAAVYLIVVKPVGDFFGEYSVVSKEAFETGFIILAIIAFQPTFFRIEEILERVLLKDREDAQTKVREIGAHIANATTEDELESRLMSGFRAALDTSAVHLHLDGTQPRFQRLAPILEEIGEPLTREALLKMGERGSLNAGHATARGNKPGGKLSREEAKRGLDEARTLAADDEVLVPILKDDHCVGFLGVGDKTIGLKYAAEELALFAVVSNQIGVALDNIRLLRENVEKKLLEEELEIARRIQRQLLPPSAPAIDGWELSASTVSSRQVGGDYYDHKMSENNMLILVVADVSGKGIPASLLMATLHAAVNSNADARLHPALMLDRMNELLYDSTSPEEFATLFYGVVDLSSGTMTYANAGHEFPFLCGGDGLTALDQSGIVLGCVTGQRYQEFKCQIPNGTSLVLYTDGITDAGAADEFFGTERLRDELQTGLRRSSHDLHDAILTRVRSFTEGGDYRDDLTLVVLKRD